MARPHRWRRKPSGGDQGQAPKPVGRALPPTETPCPQEGQLEPHTTLPSPHTLPVALLSSGWTGSVHSPLPEVLPTPQASRVLATEPHTTPRAACCGQSWGRGLGTHLHKHSPAQPCFHQGLGHPAGSVSRRAVHLGVVLPGEGPTAVRPPAAVGVHDDLPASDARIPLQRERGTQGDESRAPGPGKRALRHCDGWSHRWERVPCSGPGASFKGPLAWSRPDTWAPVQTSH